MKKLKIIMLNLLGLVTTAATLAVIYFILYLKGDINHLDRATVIEFITMILLSGTTKVFWYMSTESSVRSSEKYTSTRDKALDAINETVTDTIDFDEFVDNQNTVNYNTYVSARCKGITHKNYKLSFKDKLINFGLKLCRKPQRSKVECYNEFVKKVERKASKLHKLSSFNITTLCSSDEGLIDDRNISNKKKKWYLIKGFTLSFFTMFATAMISFQPNPDVDQKAAIVKMVMYTSSILMAILQTVFTAFLNVQKNDTEYFRKICKILDKYEAYKTNRVHVEKVDYTVKEEVKDAVDNKSIDTINFESINNTGRNFEEYQRQVVRYD